MDVPQDSRSGPVRSPHWHRGAPFEFKCDGRTLQAYPGETVASALLAAGIPALRRGEVFADPRSLFCGMGSCFECRITIDGRANRRACMTAVEPGMAVRTGPPEH